MKYLIAFLFIIVPLHISPQEAFLKQIQAHFLVEDYASACEIAQQALFSSPLDSDLHVAFIKALAHSGDEKRVWQAWDHYKSLFPAAALANQEVQEVMAWGTIWKASDSSLPMIRLAALLGAFFANDAKSIPLLKKFCSDKNSLVRGAAVQLCGSMRDAQLCDEIYGMFFKETNWRVYLEVIKAIGNMKIKRSQHRLLGIIANDLCSEIEKAAAIESLLALLEKIDRDKIVSLCHSNRAGLRLLACEVVSHLRSDRDADQMFLLSSDNHAEVRAAALHALGLLNLPASKNALIKLAWEKWEDSVPEVAITAAWLLTIQDPKEQQRSLYAVY